MNNIRFDRLEKLADHLENSKLGNGRFNHSIIVSGFNPKKGCGTSGNEKGELPFIFPDDWEFKKNLIGYSVYLKKDSSEDITAFSDLKTFFELSIEATSHLFSSYMQLPELFGGELLIFHAAKRQVSGNIRAFIEKMKSK